MILLNLFMYLSAGKCWQLLATAFMNYGRVTQGGEKVEREGRVLWSRPPRGHWCEHCMSNQSAAECLMVLVCTDEVAGRGNGTVSAIPLV
jgi:hypothetical protein